MNLRSPLIKCCLAFALCVSVSHTNTSPVVSSLSTSQNTSESGYNVASRRMAALATDLSYSTKKWPTYSLVNSKKVSAPIVVEAGETFDGKNQVYERSNCACQGQVEGGDKDAVFILMKGATLKNVIIGPNQREGVHCKEADCTVENVWWDIVCEDALTIKGKTAGTARILGGGARNAEDKIIQHNAPGNVIIDGFYARDFGKLYRSCGTCGNIKRTVVIKNVQAVNPRVSVATVNRNNGDCATLENVLVRWNDEEPTVCATTNAYTDREPVEVSSGPDGKFCKYATSGDNGVTIEQFSK